jgi:hypothetical protein
MLESLETLLKELSELPLDMEESDELLLNELSDELLE